MAGQRPRARARDRARGRVDEQLGVAGLSYPDAKKAVLAAFNDAYVARILEETNGNVSEAARRSGLDRSNFRRLLRSTSGNDDKDE